MTIALLSSHLQVILLRRLLGSDWTVEYPHRAHHYNILNKFTAKMIDFRGLSLVRIKKVSLHLNDPRNLELQDLYRCRELLCRFKQIRDTNCRRKRSHPKKNSGFRHPKVLFDVKVLSRYTVLHSPNFPTSVNQIFRTGGS